MPTLVFKFPAGRYHATPWGHHVNEGLVEWPPCPWRLLRALIATGYSTLGWSDVPPVARSLIESLASVTPSYVAPRVALAHSRHYMPLGKLDKGREKTTLVFDAWARVPDGAELAITWGVQLAVEEVALLRQLAGNMSYLGRSESWVEGRVLGDNESLPSGETIVVDDGRPSGRRDEDVLLLAAVSAGSYAAWRDDATAQLATTFAPAPGKKPTKALLEKRKKAEAEYPADLVACLQCDNGALQASGWSQPPGTRRVLYRRPTSLMQVAPAVRPARSHMGEDVEAVLLALSTLTGNKHALPHVHRTVAQADLLHKALVSALGRGESVVSGNEIVGRDAARKPLEGHQHLHILPLDLDDDQHLDHVLLWAPGGLGERAMGAIREVRKTWAKKLPDLRVAFAGSGSLESFRPLNPVLESIVGNASLVWESLTPFVPPRFLKPHGKNSLEGQVQAELASRGLPLATKIEMIERDLTLARGYRHFVRERSNPRGPARDTWFALRIELEQPIGTPLTLGHASHFGLGLFRAASAPTPRDA